MIETFGDVLWPWVVTYLAHSTLLIALVWLLARRRAAGSEALWRAALFGGLVTSTLALALEIQPVGGRIDVAPARTPAAATTPPAPRTRPPAPRTRPPAAADGAVALPAPPAPVAGGGVPAATAPPLAAPPRVSWGGGLAIVWGLGVAALLGRRLRARRRLGRRLADRRPAPALAARVRALAARAGVRTPVRVTVSARLEGPVVLGVRRTEICVPARAEAELTPAQLEAMLAHELAHVVRRDGLWLSGEGLLLACAWIQPLNHLAVRRLRRSRELACDAWAVAWTRAPLALAECLARIAGWLVEAREPHVVPAMARPGSALGERVARLLEGGVRPPRRAPGLLVAAGLLAAVAAAAPSASAGPRAPAPPAGRLADHPAVSPGADAAGTASLDQALAGLEADLDALVEAAGALDDPRVRRAVQRIDARARALRGRRRLLQSDPTPEVSR